MWYGKLQYTEIIHLLVWFIGDDMFMLRKEIEFYFLFRGKGGSKISKTHVTFLYSITLYVGCMRIHNEACTVLHVPGANISVCPMMLLLYYYNLGEDLPSGIEMLIGKIV